MESLTGLSQNVQITVGLKRKARGGTSVLMK